MDEKKVDQIVSSINFKEKMTRLYLSNIQYQHATLALCDTGNAEFSGEFSKCCPYYGNKSIQHIDIEEYDTVKKLGGKNELFRNRN